MMSLSNYELLVYLRDNPGNDESDTVALFGQATYARLRYLSQQEAIKPSVSRINDGSCVCRGYELTSIGHMLIEDYEKERKKALGAKKEERLWKLATMLISLIAVLKSFWPEICSIWQAIWLGQ